VFSVWEALVRNDKTNRPSLKMECLKGGHFKVREGRDAPYKRQRCRALEAGQPEKSKQNRDQFDTIPDLLRAIEGLGCRVIQIENLAWQIESSEASRGSCLLVGSYGGKQSKPSRYEGGSSRLGRSKKASGRSRNGTRPMGRGEQSHDSRMDEVREVFGKWLGAIRNLMDAMPSSLAARANPSDPECAKRAIQEGIDQIFVTIQKAEGAFK
jgi:hypothetical protein